MIQASLLYTYLSVGLVSLLALLGVATLRLDQSRLETFVRYAVSFSAGSLFGDTFLHLLPETAASHGFDTATGLAVLLGLVLAFVLETYVSWHHHLHPHADRPSPMTYTVLFGDSVHNAIDGVIIAASYLTSVPVGVATTIAIAFHEIPKEIGNYGVLVYGGVPRVRALGYNFLTALTAFAGATAVVALTGNADQVIHILLPVAAGNFVYIAGSDLLPELARETDAGRSTLQLLTFLGGIGIMYLLTL